MADLTDVQAINKFFGKKEGQSLTEFMQEMKALSAADKAELGDLARAELSAA